MWIKDVLSCCSSLCPNTFLASVVKIYQKLIENHGNSKSCPSEFDPPASNFQWYWTSAK